MTRSAALLQEFRPSMFPRFSLRAVRAAWAASLLAGLPLAAGAAQPPGAPAPDAPAAAAPAAAAPAAGTTAPAAAGAAAAGSDAAKILAVVNGDVISREDVNNRRRLFALSTGLPMSPDVLDRLSPQIVKQLIDERLRLQEIQRRRLVVTDQEIAKAIADVEARNGMAPGTLRQRLSADNVEFRTLVDQMRVQIGWTRVLREVMGAQAQVTPADIAEQERLLKQQVGQTEFRVGEIFIPAETPAALTEAQGFADTVIQQLRAGAPFPVVAAQFSQSQTALQGGDLGWVQPNQLDPSELRVLNEMPVGAVSNPLRVPGGFAIVSLHGKREIGKDPATLLTLRQAFFPFTAKLDPANPTEQQKQTLEKARGLTASAKDCPAVEAAGKATGSSRPVDPGEVRLETVSPGLREVLSTIPIGRASQPLVAEDGILVLMVCTREEKNLGLPSKQELTDRVLNDRVELASRQLMRDLQRRALLDVRS
jgi:peptidyl-prolyl cis-trans isomerase SurA